jgi:hypothetical protein
LHHFATFIKAAFGANAVGHAGLTTIRAKRRLGDTQSIVRAPFAGTSFGVSSFWIWHNYSVLLRFIILPIVNFELPIDIAYANSLFQIGNWQWAIGNFPFAA